MRTGQRFYPHLIRTIWATEYLDSDPGLHHGGDDAGGYAGGGHEDLLRYRPQRPARQSQSLSRHGAAHGLSGALGWRKWT